MTASDPHIAEKPAFDVEEVTPATIASDRRRKAAETIMRKEVAAGSRRPFLLSATLIAHASEKGSADARRPANWFRLRNVPRANCAPAWCWAKPRNASTPPTTIKGRAEAHIRPDEVAARARKNRRTYPQILERCIHVLAGRMLMVAVRAGSPIAANASEMWARAGSTRLRIDRGTGMS
jgi:hypothetical protein